MRYRQRSSTGLFILTLSILSTGCQSYQPQPITNDRIDNSLSIPSNDNLQARADELHNPYLPPVIIDDRDGLSPDEAAVLAVLLNPSLRTFRNRRNMADAQLMQARLLPNPTLSADLDTPVGGSSDGSITAAGFGLSYDLAELITRNDRIASAQLSAQSIDLDIAWQEWQIAQAARLAVIDLDSINKQIAIYKTTLQYMHPDLDRITYALQNGRAVNIQLSRATALLDDLRSRELHLEMEQTNKRARLNQLLGFPPSRNDPVRVADNDLPLDQLPDRETLLNGIKQHRLDLLALKIVYDKKEILVHSAVLRQFPRITVGVRQLRDTDNLQTAGFGITIDLPLFDTGRARIKIAEADRQAVYDEYVSRIFQARSDINRIIDAMTVLRQQQAQAEQVRRRRNDYLNQLIQSSQEGNTTLESLMKARSDYAVSAIRVVKIKTARIRATIALEITTGTPPTLTNIPPTLTNIPPTLTNIPPTLTNAPQP